MNDDVEMLRVLVAAIKCGQTEVIDCIIGRDGQPGDVKLPLPPDASARLLLAHLRARLSPPNQPISDADHARIKTEIDRA